MITDSLKNFKPMGWSGMGHMHWYTPEDPKGDLGCRLCVRYVTPGACSLGCPVHTGTPEECPEVQAH